MYLIMTKVDTKFQPDRPSSCLRKTNTNPDSSFTVHQTETITFTGMNRQAKYIQG